MDYFIDRVLAESDRYVGFGAPTSVVRRIITSVLPKATKFRVDRSVLLGFPKMLMTAPNAERVEIVRQLRLPLDPMWVEMGEGVIQGGGIQYESLGFLLYDERETEEGHTYKVAWFKELVRDKKRMNTPGAIFLSSHFSWKTSGKSLSMIRMWNGDKVNSHQLRVHNLVDTIEELSDMMLTTAMAMLHEVNSERQFYYVEPETQKPRMDSVPGFYLCHKTIELARSTQPVEVTKPREGDSGIKMPLHEVRGHWRRHWKTGERSIWVAQHLKGDPKYGVITHSYEVNQPSER